MWFIVMYAYRNSKWPEVHVISATTQSSSWERVLLLDDTVVSDNGPQNLNRFVIQGIFSAALLLLSYHSNGETEKLAESQKE